MQFNNNETKTQRGFVSNKNELMLIYIVSMGRGGKSQSSFNRSVKNKKKNKVLFGLLMSFHY